MSTPDRRIAEMTAAGLNLIDQALSIYDRNLLLVAGNRRFQEMFNLPDALVRPGARFSDTIRFMITQGEYGEVEDVEDFVAQRTATARAFEPHFFERTRANGKIITVEGAPLPMGGWVAVYTDITRAKTSDSLLRARSEELSEKLIAYTEELAATNRELAATNAALEEAKRELTEMEARTRLTTEMMPAHIAHVGPDGIYTYSNRRLSAVIPGRPSEIVGLHISDALGADAYGRIEPRLAAAYDGENPVFEFTETQDGRRIRVAFTPDETGGVYILSMDVTAETQTRVALQQTRRREMAAQMTSGLAHDFANLLTIILGMQGRLARADLAPEAIELVEATRAAARRGGRLLNQIADMTSARSLRPRPTDLHQLLADLAVLAGPSLPRGIGLSVVDHTPRLPVMLDDAMLQDALLNLVLNARDACGLQGQITVTAHRVGTVWTEIVVTDTGPGFSTEALKNALNPFFTTKGSEGTGLGLPMVYDMVKLAGGDLRLSNTVTGAAVTLRLPHRPAPTATSGAVSGGLCLLVEDDADLRAGFRDMLMDLGYIVIEATSVDEAMALTADLPDLALVLSDIRLQGDATGLDLRDRLSTQEVPVVLMTSLPVSDPLYQQAAALGPMLSKPFSAAALSALIPKDAA
ncbi:MAG: PAS-domain containing protein [Rhodobacteraceae bacterium]|nr:PAS-domain containing protein [Paracoccaceae bacterium]